MVRRLRLLLINGAARYLFAPRKISLQHVVLGSRYCEWPLVPKITSSKSVVYSFGLGEDISFDIAAIEKFGCDVHGFDPTPRSLRWLHAQALPTRFHLHEVGIAAQPGEMSFLAPPNAEHVSYTPSDRASPTEERIVAPVLDLRTISAQLGHTEVDILKLDIEGAEYAVIDGLSEQGCLPTQLMVEFHHGMYGYTLRETRQALHTLAGLGYLPYWISRGREYGFVLSMVL